MIIEGPEDVVGKNPSELKKIYKELSFQLRIVNNALKIHMREERFRKWFDKYPFEVREGKVNKLDIEEILALEESGFGFNGMGIPEWGPNYGMNKEIFSLLESEADLPKRIKLMEIASEFDNITHHMKDENAEQKAVRHEKILEGFDVLQT